MPSVYLDLEAEEDLSKLSQPTLYLRDHADKLVILDEVHRMPSLFPLLRGLIDAAKMDYSEFAQRADLTNVQISRILNGKSGTKRSTLPRFVQAVVRK